jgi:ribosomal-protein-alanine N-acetyltransferase
VGRLLADLPPALSRPVPPHRSLLSTPSSHSLPSPSLERAEGEPGPSPVLGNLCLLGPEDGADCVSLDRLALGGLWSGDQWDRELREAQRPVVGVRQETHLLAVASGWLVVDELHITAVAVHPDHRQRGLGRRVLEALLVLAQRAGATRATLEVSTTNGAARALYASVGFQEVAIRRRYYRNGDDALIHFKPLKP